MDHGRIAQIGTPHDLYDRPNSRFVADFIGDANLIEGHVEAGVFHAGDLALPVEGGDGRALISVRPERIALGPPETAPIGRIESASYLGSRIEYVVSTGFGDLLVSAPIGAEPRTAGTLVGLHLSGAVRTASDEGTT
jgi:iron(III) transport system ATP-binding protein